MVYAGRGEHFSAMQKKGLKITGIWGDHIVPPGEIVALDGMAPQVRKFTTILLCVKSKDTDDAAAQAAPLLEEDGIMVSIQNGLNNWETIARHVGEDRTVGARVITGAEIQAPGQARVTVSADDVLLGEPFLPVNRSLLQIIARRSVTGRAYLPGLFPERRSGLPCGKRCSITAPSIPSVPCWRFPTASLARTRSQGRSSRSS